MNVPKSSCSESSRFVRNAGLYFARKAWYAFGSLSTLTPSTTTPFEAYSSAKRLIDGVSWIHGGHQLAQKFRMRTLPPKFGMLTDCPLSAVIVKSGLESP